MNEKKVKNIFVQHAITPGFIAESIEKHSSKKDIGAHSIFLGQVRNDIIEGNEVKAIEYSAYEEMANEAMMLIREQIFEKYKLTCMHIYHSMGVVQTGHICLFVFTSSMHRIDAMNACEEVVEKIKKELPIWGKEIFEEGYVWKNPNMKSE